VVLAMLLLALFGLVQSVPLRQLQHQLQQLQQVSQLETATSLTPVQGAQKYPQPASQIFYWDCNQVKEGAFLTTNGFKDVAEADATFATLLTEGGARTLASGETLTPQYIIADKLAVDASTSGKLWKVMAIQPSNVHWGVLVAKLSFTLTSGTKSKDLVTYWVGGADNTARDAGNQHTELRAVTALKDFMTAFLKTAKSPAVIIFTKIEVAFILQKAPCTISGHKCDTLLHELSFATEQTGNGNIVPSAKHVVSFFAGAGTPAQW